MQVYHNLMEKIIAEGDEVNNERTGVGTIAIFGEQIKFDLRKGFPAVTTKKLAWNAVIAELLWFIRGSTQLGDLKALTFGEEHRNNPDKKTIWDDNYLQQGVKELGYKDGYCGLVYGSQWRGYGLDGAYVEEDFGGQYYKELPKIDQLAEMINEAMNNPGSRRLLVEAWNPQLVWNFNKNGPGDGNEYAVNKPILPPCHLGFQIRISGDYIDLLWKQRSVDVFLGLAFNIASYGALLHILGRILGKTPRYLTGQLGDCHIYKNHLDQVHEQLSRQEYELPTLSINPELKIMADFERATKSDFLLENYQSHPSIKAPMAV